MRSPVHVLGLSAVCLAASLPAAAQASGSSAAIQATATVAPRTTARASSDVLRFRIEPGSGEAVATLEFTCGSRVPPSAVVELSIEALSGMIGPGGAADLDTELTFSADAPGALSGTWSPAARVVLARWAGGGLRSGRIRFRLTSTSAGIYEIPVRLAVTVP